MATGFQGGESKVKDVRGSLSPERWRAIRGRWRKKRRQGNWGERVNQAFRDELGEKKFRLYPRKMGPSEIDREPRPIGKQAKLIVGGRESESVREREREREEKDVGGGQEVLQPSDSSVRSRYN